MSTSDGKNPYVGPRAYSPEDKKEGRPFYGRERELEELTDLLLSQRVVLMYAPSGAGKTSLINAELIPRMRDEEGFDVLPTISVKLPAESPGEEVDHLNANRYVNNALLSIGGGLHEGRRPAVGPGVELADYLAAIQAETDGGEEGGPRKPQLIIFDQFEEVLTLDSTDVRAKKEFFTQVGKALRDRRRWVLFSMREDYVAALDPYLSYIHTRFASTFRLDFLDKEQACLAIQLPAKEAGVNFRGIAVRKLVDDLSMVRVQRTDGGFDPPRSGPYVEPVQLQVVCRQLWEKRPRKDEIGRGDLDLIGDVDAALANYYQDKVSQAAAVVQGLSERLVRQWVEGLMTEHGVRVPVLHEERSTHGLDNRAVDLLVNAHILRREERGNRIWYELAHDRLIEPVRKNNRGWLEVNLSEGWELSRAEMQEFSPVAKGERRGAALCLGGGGFRAALFHLGALTRLNQLGVLSQLRTVSAAGGGSILAAHLIKSLDPWPAAGEVVEPDYWERKVAAPFRAFTRVDVRRKTTPLILRFFEVLGWIYEARTSSASARNLWHYLEHKIIDRPLKDMPERPQFIFGATDAVFITNWVFEKSRMGDYQVGYISPPPPDWTVARAAAASAAIHPYYGAAPIHVTPSQLTGGKFGDGLLRDELVMRLELLNGSNYDHLALEPVWRTHSVVLVSDGGTKIKPAVERGFLTKLFRQFSIPNAQVDTMRKAWLLSNFMSGILQGTYWSLTRSVGEYESATKTAYSAEFVEEYISGIRTDLNSFTHAESAVLENHGYLMADVGMRRRNARYFDLRDAELQVPHPKLMDEQLARLLGP